MALREYSPLSFGGPARNIDFPEAVGLAQELNSSNETDAGRLTCVRELGLTGTDPFQEAENYAFGF